MRPVTIRSARRTMALQVRPDGSLIVRAPMAARDAAIERFVREHSDWIERTTRRVTEAFSRLRVRSFVQGGTFAYLGREYPLHLAEDMHGKLLFEDRFILSSRYLPKARRLFERWYREEAYAIFTARCQHYAYLMGVKYRSLSLTNAKARWGSCHPRGALRINWRLVMAPLEIVDYVVVHELAHLKELNHSDRFWRVVEDAYPEYESAKRWLKNEAASLLWEESLKEYKEGRDP